MTEKNPWTILGIGPTTDEQKIRQAYLTQVRRHHPDLYAKDSLTRHEHEEHMKWINWAYHEVMKTPFVVEVNKKDAPGPRESSHKASPPPLSCRLHHQPIVRTCTRCQAPLCPSCVGFSLSLCSMHFRKWVNAKFRRRVLREWGLLFVLIATSKLLSWPFSTLLWSLLGYLALLGILELRRLRYFGCMAWLFIPYSLVLAGLYSLYEGLSRWNKELGDFTD
ncbi:DnaJ domain-containing protein [Sulfobacillus thermosulfidooxidans DSM 9293]|uniref:DnaJ domain-containing protein n=1 Tax=Sulfobacillus thermosulfidooxidans (strain DSM 9293 / VKM B-1269 / AT-1) TaxID=929705 RepID=A0A1W1WD68_SULTA|nr:J domain-containing protein [Sulfobacillus thermosulfidooxidans]SMC04165.1 DnaJ domain-containing protein [Sulfobacillus thermosulfidooxidans DSM 9293]